MIARLIYKGMAFAKRDYLIESSYKLAFVIEIFKSIMPTLSFYFIGKMVAKGGGGTIPGLGIGYFPFAIVGVALSQYLLLSLGAFSNTIRRQQMAGCLEAMLSTRTSSAVVILLSPLYGFLAKTFHIFLVLAFGGVFLGVDYSRMNLVSVVVVVVLSLISFSSLGILSATVILLWKKGDPITWFVGTFGSLFGGAFFPREVMPGWMAKAALVNPFTHALDAMRLAMFKGAPVELIWKQLLILGATGMLLLPISVWLFSSAVEKGRRDGSLLHY